MNFIHPIPHSRITELAKPLAPSAVFKPFALLSTVGVLCYILVSIVFAPASEPMYHFSENGAITALSSVCMAMSGALALVVFYLRTKAWTVGGLFWILLACGCIFLSLDEQLMLHERGGRAISATSVGEPEFFRNWNDIIVIGYGIVALGVGAFFAREIVKCKVFAALFVIGFLFYMAHTGLDSTLPNTVLWKDIPEESSKLLSVFSLFLALAAQTLAQVENILAQR